MESYELLVTSHYRNAGFSRPFHWLQPVIYQDKASVIKIISSAQVPDLSTFPAAPFLPAKASVTVCAIPFTS